MVIEDIIICEFDGFNLNWGADKTLKWKIYFASGRAMISTSTADILIDNSRQLYFILGYPQYYMGVDGESFVFRAYQKRETSWPRIELIELDELLDTFGIRVIHYEFAPPINNTFT